MPAHVRKSWIPWTTLVVLTALTVGAATVALHDQGAPGPLPLPSVIAPFNGLGGYTAIRPFSQISVVWKVPAIGAHSAPGSAVTWVGAQYRHASFIQLGTLEVKIPFLGDQYEAFWSDIALNFHPAPIGTVHPGDLVTAAMTHRTGGWTLKFVDLTTRLRRTITTSYGRHAHYDLAEWIQEDPAPGLVTDRDVAYPTLSAVSMALLSVDGHALPAGVLSPDLVSP